MFNLEKLNWPESGLLPAIAQDAGDGRVVTLAWQNREALQATLAERRTVFWSRSRQALWRKGETSGHTQRLVDIRFDCDLDAILLLVEPAGPACHTGRSSCFFNEISAGDECREVENPWPQADILSRLAAVIAARREAGEEKSYVKSLLGDPQRAAEKVREEAGELIAAAADESDERVAGEAADLVFHALVLAASRGVDWSRIAAVLDGRFGTSGHEEKAARGAVGKTATPATATGRNGSDRQKR